MKLALVLVHIIMVCVSTGANCLVFVTKNYACPHVSRTCHVPILCLCPLVSTMGTALCPEVSWTCHMSPCWTWDARTFPTKRLTRPPIYTSYHVARSIHVSKPTRTIYICGDIAQMEEGLEIQFISGPCETANNRDCAIYFMRF